MGKINVLRSTDYGPVQPGHATTNIIYKQGFRESFPDMLIMFKSPLNSIPVAVKTVRNFLNGFRRLIRIRFPVYGSKTYLFSMTK
jgi:hypothetical protein